MLTPESRAQRRTFINGMLLGLRVIAPVLTGLLAMIVGLGVVAGLIEGWPFGDSIYFAFVSGLTIGYGDVVPKTFPGRVLAIMIGVCGVLVTALLAGIAVKALNAVSNE